MLQWICFAARLWRGLPQSAHIGLNILFSFEITKLVLLIKYCMKEQQNIIGQLSNLTSDFCGRGCVFRSLFVCLLPGRHGHIEKYVDQGQRTK